MIGRRRATGSVELFTQDLVKRRAGRQYGPGQQVPSRYGADRKLADPVGAKRLVSGAAYAGDQIIVVGRCGQRARVGVSKVAGRSN